MINLKKHIEDYVTDLISYRLMGVPFARDLFNTVKQKLDGKPATTTARMPALEGMNMIGKTVGDTAVAMQKPDWKHIKKTMWDASELLSLASGIPATRIYDRWAKGTKNIASGSGWWMNHFVPQEKKKK